MTLSDDGQTILFSGLRPKDSIYEGIKQLEIFGLSEIPTLPVIHVTPTEEDELEEEKKLELEEEEKPFELTIEAENPSEFTVICTIEGYQGENQISIVVPFDRL